MSCICFLTPCIEISALRTSPSHGWVVPIIFQELWSVSFVGFFFENGSIHCVTCIIYNLYNLGSSGLQNILKIQIVAFVTFLCILHLVYFVSRVESNKSWYLSIVSRILQIVSGQLYWLNDVSHRLPFATSILPLANDLLEKNTSKIHVAKYI